MCPRCLALPSLRTGFPMGHIQGRAVLGCWKPCQGNKAATITLASGLPAEEKKTLAAPDAFLRALEISWF